MKASKRLLALVLCLAMVLSLGTVAFAAESAGIDQGELAAAPAQVQWLVDNGYVIGYDDGSLGLDTNITRAQFATILARADGLADEDAATYAPMAATYFSDMGGWYDGYVAYCYGKGIVAGYGDGTFKPEQPVTGIEAAKMILCSVLDYDQAPYTGSALWSFNVMTDAEAAGLLADVEANLSEAIDRENAFIMLYNALYAPALEGHGLAYVRDYDVAALYLLNPEKADGSDDNAYEYTIADGDYTADSFKPLDPGATIELFEYTVDTTTTKGVLTPVSVVTLGDEAGEQYFFVKVTDTDGVETWYKFFPAGKYEYAELSGIITANKYADLYNKEPLKKDYTALKLDNGDVIILDIHTTLDQIGLAYDVSTGSYAKDAYAVVAFEEGKNKVDVIYNSQKDFEKAGRDARRAETFVNFGTGTTDDQYEVLAAFVWDGVAYPKGEIAVIDIDALKEDYAAGKVYDTKTGDDATTLAWRLFSAEHLEEANAAFDSFDDLDYRDGYIYKFIDNGGNPEYDLVLELAYYGSAGCENKPGATPRDPGFITFAEEAVEFAGFKLGADGPTKDECLVVEIDGITYVTLADYEIVTPSKDTDFESGIFAFMGREHITAYGNPDLGEPYYMFKGETYKVYFDLTGSSFAAKLAGTDYALVTQLDHVGGNVRGYSYEAELTIRDIGPDGFDVYFPTTKDLTAIENIYARNGVNNEIDPWYWTTLASYLEGEEGDAFDYELLAPYVNPRNGVGYVAFDDSEDIIDLSFLSPATDLEAELREAMPVPMGPMAFEVNDRTEIYVVKGDDLRNVRLAFDVEFFAGVKAFNKAYPVILAKDIHGIYGIVDGPSVKTLVIEVTNLSNYDVTFAVKNGARTYQAIDETALVNISRANPDDYNGPAFYFVEDGALYEWMTAGDAFKNYVQWLPFVMVQDGMDKNIVKAVFSAENDYVDYIVNTVLSVSYFYDPAAAMFTANANTAPIYKVVKAGPYYEIVPVDTREERIGGDYIVGVFGDNSITATTTWRNTQFSVSGITYYIDITLSDPAVQEYFGFHGSEVTGQIETNGDASLNPLVGPITLPVALGGNGEEVALRALLAAVPEGYTAYDAEGELIGFDFDGSQYILTVAPITYTLSLETSLNLIPDGFKVDANGIDLTQEAFEFTVEDVADVTVTLTLGGRAFVLDEADQPEGSFYVTGDYDGYYLTAPSAAETKTFLADGGTVTVKLADILLPEVPVEDYTLYLGGIIDEIV